MCILITGVAMNKSDNKKYQASQHPLNRLVNIIKYIFTHEWDYIISPYVDLPGVIRVCKKCRTGQWKGCGREWINFGNGNGGI